MFVYTAYYPFVPGGKFDEDYYHSRHIPLMYELWGDLIQGLDVVRGLAGLDGSDPAYRLCGHVSFASLEDIHKAMAHPRIEELIADVPNYTDLPIEAHIGQR